jgi:NADPH:quinone reductase-like Zn-dependent oxidoreductase
MEAYRIDRFDSVDGIVLRSSEDPRPGPKDILLWVRANSLNYRDLMVLKGGDRGPTKLGVVPLSDGAGEVAAIGDGVTRVKVGDRIAGTFHPRWFGGPIRPEYITDRLGANFDGMLAEYAVLERGSARPRSKPPFLRGRRHLALCCGDRVGRADRPSQGQRRRYRLDAGFRGSVGICAAVCPAPGRAGDRDDLDRGEG